MPALSLPSFPVTLDSLPDDIAQKFAGITTIITDTDNTMVSHGNALCAADGTPSTELVEALIALKRAGIRVVPNTGRNRAMIREDARILGLDAWIGEMGGIICTKEASQASWTYFTADMDYDPATGLTPHEVIMKTGVVDRMLKRWYDCLETYNDNNIGYQYREVTVALRGAVLEDEAQQMLDETGLALYLADNGFVHKITGNTILPDFEHLAEDVHTYHITPRGLNKGSATAKYIELMGIEPDQVLAAGDSPADCEMAPYVGTFLLMKNGINNPKTQALLADADNAWVSSAPSTDGFVRMAKTLVALKRRS